MTTDMKNLRQEKLYKTHMLHYKGNIISKRQISNQPKADNQGKVANRYNHQETKIREEKTKNS